MFQPAELTICLIVPAVVAMTAAVAIRERSQPDWFEPSIALGYVAGHLLLTVHAEWTTRIGLGQTADGTWRTALHQGFRLLAFPRAAYDWLPMLMLIAVMVTFASPTEKEGLSLSRRFVRQIPWLIGAMLVVTRLLWGSNSVESEWSPDGTLLRLAGLAFAIWLPSQICVFGRSRDPHLTSTGLTSLIVTAAATGITLLLSGSKIFGMYGLIATSAMTGASLIEASSHRKTVKPPRILPMLFGSLIILGMFFSELTPGHAILLYVSLILSCIQLQMPEFLASQKQKLICSLIAITLAVSVVAFATFQFARHKNSELTDSQERSSITTKPNIGFEPLTFTWDYFSLETNAL